MDALRKYRHVICDWFSIHKERCIRFIRVSNQWLIIIDLKHEAISDSKTKERFVSEDAGFRAFQLKLECKGFVFVI